MLSHHASHFTLFLRRHLRSPVLRAGDRGRGGGGGNRSPLRELKIKTEGTAPAPKKLTVCVRRRQQFLRLCSTSAFEALSLSHLIFLSILPDNFYDLCPRMRKPKLCKSHGLPPRSASQPGERLEPDLRSHDSHSVKGEMTCGLDSPAQGFPTCSNMRTPFSHQKLL